MKNQKVVYIASGANQGTYGPLCFFENFTGNLKETTFRCRSYDDDGLVPVDLYLVKTVEMPEWMSDPMFKTSHIHMAFAVALAGKPVLDLPVDAFYRIISLSEKEIYWYGWALKSKSRFVQDLLFGFNQWLSGASQYPSPLSKKQWAAAVRYCPVYNAQKISNKLYYSATL